MSNSNENSNTEVSENGVPCNIMPIYFDEHGCPSVRGYLTPETMTRGMVVRVPPETVIPVIFIPGIMGTNLRSKDTQMPAWQPPNGLIQKVTTLRSYSKKSAADRQKLLDPNNTEVFAPDNFEFKENYKNHDGRVVFHRKEAIRRGWGDVHWDSYGDFLVFAEEYLNNKTHYEFDEGTKDNIKKEWQALCGDLTVDDKDEFDLFAENNWNFKNIIQNLTEKELEKCDKYYFPVHVIGYNWLQSNELAGEDILRGIQKTLDFYTDHKSFDHINKVILVTHSMGGLCSRYAASLDTKKQILGIVHGVQPVNGAPVVYRRMRAGTEAEAFRTGFFYLLYLYDLVRAKGEATVLGPTAPDMVAVMANAPGVLELLPNKRYNEGKPWLKFFAKDKNGNDFELKELALPKNGDPYEEIYAISVQDKWWGMIDSSLLDPLDNKKKIVKKINNFKIILNKVKDFHEEKLQDFFLKNNTYAYYGNFEAQPAYDEVIWKTEDEFPEGFTEDKLKNSLYINPTQDPKALNPGKDIIDTQIDMDKYHKKAWHGQADVIVYDSSGNPKILKFQLQERNPDDKGDGWGDGTVPAVSAQGVSGRVKVEINFKMGNAEESKSDKKSFNHQESYNHDAARLFAIWSVVKILEEVN